MSNQVPEIAKTASKKTANYKLPEYQSWRSMRDRCLRLKNVAYPDYGGRGITVCECWRESFENFLADMGPRPSRGHSIDRIDTNGNYEPSNCRWATLAQQLNNTRNSRFLTYEGRTLTETEWSRETGIKVTTIDCRLKAGWSIAKALTAPVRGGGRKTILPDKCPQGHEFTPENTRLVGSGARRCRKCSKRKQRPKVVAALEAAREAEG